MFKLMQSYNYQLDQVYQDAMIAALGNHSHMVRLTEDDNSPYYYIRSSGFDVSVLDANDRMVVGYHVIRTTRNGVTKFTLYGRDVKSFGRIIRLRITKNNAMNKFYQLYRNALPRVCSYEEGVMIAMLFGTLYGNYQASLRKS